MILVTGASGKNGAEILKLLSGRKERIRAMSRKRKDVASAGPTCGLEFVEADFEDAESMRKGIPTAGYVCIGRFDSEGGHYMNDAPKGRSGTVSAA